MTAVPNPRVAGMSCRLIPRRLVSLALVLMCAASPYAQASESSKPARVQVKLSEWQVALEPKSVPAGSVVFEVTNAGTIPHAFEVEGRNLEKSTPQIQPGQSATLALTLPAGRYEA